MDKEALGAIIVTALLVLSISSPIVSAVTINYEADSDGDYIYIHDNYEIDNTVTVTETTDLYFVGDLHVDQERTAEGTGKTDLEQTITGKPMEGAGYVAENDISNDGTIDATTSTSATANTLGVDQEVFATGYTDLHLEGEKADNKAGHDAGVNSGMLRSKQTLVIENSVRTSLDTSIRGISGHASSWAEDADENKASTFVRVDKGKINTKQKSEADGSATASKLLTASGHGIEMGCRASNAEGDHANMDASVGLGAIAAFDAAKAIKKKATTTDNLAAIGREIQKRNYASNAEGDYAGTYASVGAGILVSCEDAEAVIDKAAAYERLTAAGSGIEKGSYAGNAEGDYASTGASVDKGLIVSYDKAKAVIDKAKAYERLTAAGSGIWKGSYARNAEGDYAGTGASVDRGLVVSYDKAKAVIDKAAAYERLTAAGSGIEKGSYAGNAEGDYAGTGASVDRGLVVSYDKAKAVIDKAAAYERLTAAGSGIEKGSYAGNAEGDYAGTGASVDRGLVVSYDKAKAVIDKAAAYERLTAAGSGIEKGSEAWNAEGDYAGTGASVDRGLVVSYDEAEAIIDKATASEVLVATGSGIWKGSRAWNEEGDYAGTGASVDSGLVVSYDKAEAIIDKATASEVLAATGSGIWKGSRAWNEEGDYAGTVATVDSGLVVSYDKAEAIIDKAKASEVLAATGSGIWKGSEAGNAEGDYAGTVAWVDSGLVVSYDKAEAVIDKAKASEVLAATGSGIVKASQARNAEGDYAGRETSVDNGFLVSYDNAEAIIGKATASEVLAATGSGIVKASQARNAEGDYASRETSVDNGFLVSYDNAEAVIDKAKASELLAANGSGIQKGSYAENAEGDYASRETSVDNGFLVSYDNAEAVIDKAKASELLAANGSGIRKASYAENAEGDYASRETSVDNGFLVSYDNAEAVIDKAKASELLAANGSGIRKASYAENAEGDYASRETSVDNGFLVSYDNAEAVIDKAKASELLVANGSEIQKGSYARNDKGVYASTGAFVDTGFLVSYDNAQAIKDSTMIVAGSMITGDGGTDSSVTNARGDSSTYASIENGTLLSFLVAASAEKMTGAMQIALAEGELIKAGDISHFPHGYVRNDVEVSNGDLTAGMGTAQMPLDDIEVGGIKLTKIDTATAGMLMHTDSCDSVKASAEAKNANGYARNDVEVTNGDLTAGMGTIQMPFDMKFKKGRIKLKVTEMDNAVAGMYMHTDSCDSVTASAEANNIHSGTAYDAYTGSGTVTKLPIAGMIHLYYDLHINMPWPLPDIDIEDYFDEQLAEVTP